MSPPRWPMEISRGTALRSAPRLREAVWKTVRTKRTMRTISLRRWPMEIKTDTVLPPACRLCEGLGVPFPEEDWTMAALCGVGMGRIWNVHAYKMRIECISTRTWRGIFLGFGHAIGRWPGRDAEKCRFGEERRSQRLKAEFIAAVMYGLKRLRRYQGANRRSRGSAGAGLSTTQPFLRPTLQRGEFFRNLLGGVCSSMRTDR
jgi:hypothetical protein